MAIKQTLLGLVWCFMCTGVCVWSASVHIFVSPHGSDSNDGHQVSNPVKTFGHVLDMLKALDNTQNTVFVELMAGYHELSSTLHIQSTPGTVVFRAYQGQEVHLTGGTRIDVTKFHPVTDSHVRQRLPQVARDKVLELDLTSAGLTDLGTLRPFGFGKSWLAPLEIFINGNPLRLAEWPNSNFINILSVPDGQHGKRFTFDSAGRDVSWAQETEPWVYGWWYWSWADLAAAVEGIDSHSHTITLKEPTNYGLQTGHYDPAGGNLHGYSGQGGYFRVFNMLCEIDQPGEYYIDRRNKKLYVWPNTPQETLTSSDVVLASLIDDCIIVENAVRNLHFEDFSIEACRRHGFQLMSVQNLTIQNMEIKNTGANAVHCSGNCLSVTVAASDIHHVNGGVSLGGGSRTSLVSSENVIRDNHIWEHGRYGAQSNHALSVGGVNVLVSHNHIHHGRYTAIWWRGNDHVIEYNHLHHECFNASDCGAIHSGRDWTCRGNIIRNNHIHDVQRHMPGADVRGIMLDDEYSAVLIERNVFYDNDIHANIGGGRDNIIRYNIMYKARSHSVDVDGRGLEQKGHGQELRQKLSVSPYRSDLWKQRYPELYSILDHHPEAPEGNQIYKNVMYNAPGKGINYHGSNIIRPDYFNIHDNLKTFSPSSDFTSADNADFRLRCEAARWASKVNFPAPVTLDEVGPTVPTGPYYLRVQRHQPPVTRQTPASSEDCSTTTAAPASNTPPSSYMPDGSSPNTLYPHIPKHGCWLVIDQCPSHPTAVGTQQDQEAPSSHTQQSCLARAAQQWKWCGSPGTGKVVAVYGPTGAMTFSAKGCYFADFGCTHAQTGVIHRDTWAEDNLNAADNEAACLGRAAPQWRYCGSHTDRPYTSIYGPTGAFRTAGAGCWVQVQSCPADTSLQGFFFDAWGDTNRYTGVVQEECFDRAQYYWTKCGSHDDASVTAFFRPSASNHTVP